MDARKYIEIEETLTARLSKTWRPMARKLYREMLEKVAQADFNGARELLTQLDMSDVGKKNGEFLAFSLRAAAVFGASMVSGDKNVLQSGTYTAKMKKIAAQVQQSIQYNCTIQTAKAALQSIAKAEETYNAAKETVRKADSKKRFVREFVSFQKDGDDMLQLVSSLHSSRLAVWGFTAEADVVGLTEYKLTAVLDGRTSAFCRAINGKTFKVVDARQSIENILNADSPDDLKTLQPWPKQTKAAMAEFGEMSSEQITANNWHIPPFHPGCRTLMVRVGHEIVSVPTQTKTQTQVDHLTVDQNAFGEMSFKVTERQIDYWNQMIADSPAAVFSKLSGVPALDLLKGTVSKNLHFDDNGAIRFRVTSNVLGKGSMTRTEQVYDPFAKKMYATRIQFEKADPAVVAPFFVKLYKGMLETTGQLGATALVVNTGPTAYMHARMGFVATDWDDLREDLSLMLSSGEVETAYLKLTQGQRKVVDDLLASKDPKALTALVDLPYSVDGVSFSRTLLSKVDFEATISPTDLSLLEGFE